MSRKEPDANVALGQSSTPGRAHHDGHSWRGGYSPHRHLARTSTPDTATHPGQDRTDMLASSPQGPEAPRRPTHQCVIFESATSWGLVTPATPDACQPGAGGPQAVLCRAHLSLPLGPPGLVTSRRGRRPPCTHSFQAQAYWQLGRIRERHRLQWQLWQRGPSPWVHVGPPGNNRAVWLPPDASVQGQWARQQDPSGPGPRAAAPSGDSDGAAVGTVAQCV